ncbi:DUF5131 family protein [Lichenibacterium dinghuense]|uniref:DUF5131 family protein n=1 Tax=Lichenibacterium dinghuense TaxID=2895977 RepID=UPI001F3C93FC|nr:phage Gp37/Gp68 family protein [Lichenibacterium sp. 6Y81]
MAETSTIEWTDATWTPIRARHRVTGEVGWHCEHASPGCSNCYSETFNELRLGTGLPFKPGHRGDVEHFLDEAMLLAPLRWRRSRRIFVCSITDLFGDWVSDAWIDRVFAVMALCSRHTFQVLTKRSARMRDYASRWFERLATGDVRVDHPTGPACFSDHVDWTILPSVLPNVWLGISAEDQRRADERVPDLLDTPAAVRFVSAEPLLGSIDLSTYFRDPNYHCPDCGGHLDMNDECPGWHEFGVPLRPHPGLDWVVVGGESGPDARPMHPDWARTLRDQCAAAGVPFLFKQWGAWKPICTMTEAESDTLYRSNRIAREGESQGTLDEFHGRTCRVPDLALGYGGATGFDAYRVVDGHGGMLMFRVGKAAAGRLLDGVEHDAMPEVGHG